MGYECSTATGQRWQHIAVGPSLDQRIAVLNGRYLMDCVRTLYGRLISCAQAELCYFSLSYEIIHSANDIFDRNSRVGAVLIEKIDPLPPKTAKRALDRATYRRR